MTKRATQSTFLLRGIDHQRLVREYLDGEYDDITLPLEKPPFSTKTTKIHFQETGIGKSRQDPVYERKTGESRFRVYTTNTDKYKAYLGIIDSSTPPTGTKKKIKETKISEPQKPQLCDHCRLDITADFLIAPIEMKRRNLADGGKRIIISGEYIVCDESCCLAVIHDELKKNPLSSQYKNSEQMLKQICVEMGRPYPKNPAPHWKLLIENGGSMDRETFRGGVTEFRRNPSLIFVVAKSQWETKLKD